MHSAELSGHRCVFERPLCCTKRSPLTALESGICMGDISQGQALCYASLTDITHTDEW